jgi:hypothetical protein
MIWRCDLVPQYEAYRSEIHAAIERVLGSGRYILGGEGNAFEREFANYLGAGECVAVANGTDGLTLSLMALGVGAGDEVVTTPFTAIPTVSAIIDAGATPVFADIRPDTFLIDPDCVAKRITPRTKAVVPVHLFGNVADVPALREVVGDGIRIVEDACQAHGSRMAGAMAGAMGDLGVFSFYPTKNLGGYGDGGAVVTGDAELAERLRMLRMYGMVDKDHIVVDGINSRLDELQAAILRVKLPHLEAMNARRNEIARRYIAELRSDLFAHQRIPSGVVSNYHVFVARVRNGRREALMRYLDARGIQTNIYYVLPLHLQKATARFGGRVGDCPVAEAICGDVIALPLYPELSEDLLSQLIETINAFQ